MSDLDPGDEDESGFPDLLSPLFPDEVARFRRAQTQQGEPAIAELKALIPLLRKTSAEVLRGIEDRLGQLAPGPALARRRYLAERLLSIVECDADRGDRRGLDLYLAAFATLGREGLWHRLCAAVHDVEFTATSGCGLAEEAVFVGEYKGVRLFLGAATDALDEDFLRRERIRGILNLCGAQQSFGRGLPKAGRQLNAAFMDTCSAKLGWQINYEEVNGLADWEAHCPVAHVDTLVSLIEDTAREVVQAPGQQPVEYPAAGVLCHCQAGQNRSAAVLVAALLRLSGKGGIPERDLLGMVRHVASKRGLILSNEGFRWQVLGLAALESKLPEVPSLAEARARVDAALSFDIPGVTIFDGDYPGPWPKVSPEDPAVTSMLKAHSLVDRAKSRQNWQRQDQDDALILRNEIEVNWLVRGHLGDTTKLVDSNRVELLGEDEFMFALSGTEFDAIVNTANECLQGGGGTDAMCHTYAGDSLKLETSALPAIQQPGQEEGLPGYAQYRCVTGQAVITSGHRLSVPFIIHVVTPFLDDHARPQPSLHVSACQSVLSFIDGASIRKLAIGPVSTGYYGYPMVEAALLLLRCIQSFLEEHPDHVDRIGLWIYNDVQRRLFAHLLGGGKD